MRINLGGEGEVPSVLNQQGPWVLDPSWRSCRHSNTLHELLTQGHRFVIADNRHLPFADRAFEEVLTNNVPIDIATHLGPGVQSSEIQRILKPGGRWVHDGNRGLYEAMTHFADLLPTGSQWTPRDVQEHAATEFPLMVRKTGFHLWIPGQPLVTEGRRLLIGIASYSRLDLEFLDELEETLSRRNGRSVHIDLFDVRECKSHEEFERFVPGIGRVYQTPVVGNWDNGVLTAKATGQQARELAIGIIAGDIASSIR